MTIAHAQLMEDLHQIVQELAQQSIHTMATELTITAKQYQNAAEIPIEYQCHANVFSEEEAQ